MWNRFSRRSTARQRTGRAGRGGNGFGCTIVRRSVLQETVFYHGGPESKWYDVNFYRDLGTDARFRVFSIIVSRKCIFSRSCAHYCTSCCKLPPFSKGGATEAADR